MKQWSTVKRYCVFVMGMVFCALGISFVTRAGLGTSPVSGLPFVLSLITEISMGTFTFLFNMLFLILEAVIRRKLGFLQLLQIPMTFCFSFFIDCHNTIINSHKIQFIKDLRSAVETLFNNTGITFYMVGETFTGDVGLINKYIGNDLLHAQFDFPLYYSIQDVLRSGNMGKVIYDKTSLNNSPYPTHLMGTFMGNHDVARALTVAAGQSKDKWKQNPEVPDSDWKSYFKVKQAMTILLTQPGVPLIYYGDEYGMEGANDPDNRRMMEFGDALNNEQKGALKYVQKLGTIRAQHPAIRRGTRKNIDQPNDQLWCYEMNDGTETIIVGIAGPEGGGDCNLGSEKTLVNLLADEPAEIKTSTLHVGDAERFQIYLVK